MKRNVQRQSAEETIAKRMIALMKRKRKQEKLVITMKKRKKDRKENLGSQENQESIRKVKNAVMVRNTVEAMVKVVAVEDKEEAAEEAAVDAEVVMAMRMAKDRKIPAIMVDPNVDVVDTTLGRVEKEKTVSQDKVAAAETLDPHAPSLPARRSEKDRSTSPRPQESQENQEEMVKGSHMVETVVATVVAEVAVVTEEEEVAEEAEEVEVMVQEMVPLPVMLPTRPSKLKIDNSEEHQFL